VLNMLCWVACQVMLNVRLAGLIYADDYECLLLLSKLMEGLAEDTAGAVRCFKLC
jgi:hypothetical protein